MRLFVAIDFPDSVKDQLEDLQGGVAGATWVKRHGFHLTLRFLGDQIAPDRLNPIMTALDEVRARAFEISLQGIGRFPPGMRGAARVLWVGIEGEPALLDLHREVEQALLGVGFPPTGQPFTPHITLARLKTSNPTPEINAFLKRTADFRSGPIPVREFILYSSVLTAQGSRYKAEEIYRLRD